MKKHHTIPELDDVIKEKRCEKFMLWTLTKELPARTELRDDKLYLVLPTVGYTIELKNKLADWDHSNLHHIIIMAGAYRKEYL